MNAQNKKERRALRRQFAGHYPLPYAQALLEKMMEQSLHYRPPSAADSRAIPVLHPPGPLAGGRIAATRMKRCGLRVRTVFYVRFVRHEPRRDGVFFLQSFTGYVVGEKHQQRRERAFDSAQADGISGNICVDLRAKINAAVE